MAEVVGLFASAVTLAATAHGAAKFAKALFEVTTTFKHARKEMADIAQRLSQFSTSLQVLADILRNNATLCRDELHANTISIIKGWKFVEAELTKLLESPSNLKRFIWAIKKSTAAKKLLKNIEGIEKALMMELSILQLAVLVNTQVDHTLPNAPAVDHVTTQRKITESVVQANRQVVESAQYELSEGEKPVDPPHGRRTDLDLRKQYTFDTATWLYHLVFGSSLSESHSASLRQPSVSDDDSDKRNGAVALPSLDHVVPTSREVIVWGDGTEPSIVVNRLLSTWTTLTPDQITANAARNEEDKWTERFLKMLQQTRVGEDTSADSDMDEASMTDVYAEQSDQGVEQKKRRSQSAETPKRVQRTSHPIPPGALPTRHVNFRAPDGRAPKHTSKAVPTSELPGRPKSTQVLGALPTASERVKRHLQSTPSPRYPQYPLPPSSGSFAPDSTNLHSYTESPYRQQYPMNRPPAARQSVPSTWSPFPHLPPSYPVPQAPPPLAAEPSVVPHQSQETVMASAERAFRTAITDDPRLSRIESLLAAQQDNIAQMKQARVHEDGGAEAKYMSNVSEEYGKIIEGLEKLLTQQREELQTTEADLQAERNQLAAMTEEHDVSMQALEQLLKQQKEQQSRNDETHQHELKIMKDQADKATKTKEAALKDAAAAQSAADEARQYLQSVKVEIEAERVLVEKRDAVTAESRREADKENAKKFQQYEKLLKASRETLQKKPELIIHQPIRQTRLMDKYHSIEVNEFTPDASDSLPALPFSPLKFFQSNTRRSDPDIQYFESSRRSTRDRNNSFHGSTTSVQSSRTPLRTLSRAGSNQESQQMLLLPPTVDRGSIGTSQLRQYLGGSGVATVFDDPQDTNDGQLVPYTEEGTQVVRSTLFWEPPVLALGSELLHTLKLSGWKPLYSRKSATGRTYFHGDQPVHSYFFKPDYTPQFLPPICSTQQDILLIDGALIEEYALIELNFRFTRTATAEYELEGWLTFGDIECLVERSFLLRESRYRAHYRKPPAVQQWLKQPVTPATQTSFSQDYPPSEASTTTKSPRSRHSSTERGHSDDEGFGTSQTSQPDISDEKSVFGGGDDVVRPPSVASWVKFTTNPFPASGSEPKTEHSRNPYRQGSLNGPSLIDL